MSGPSGPALLPESIRLARASWDAATPGSRALLFLRSRRVGAQSIPAGDLDIPFCSWDELPAETAESVAWDVQFLRRVLGDGHAALKGTAAIVAGSAVSFSA